MDIKPAHPYSAFVRLLLKKLLSPTLYNRYVGRHEHGSLRIWQALAARLSDRDAILDIGAFHGEYALAARAVNAHSSIFAFEPNPLSLVILQENFTAKSIFVEPYAVTQSSGMVSFSISSAMSHIHRNTEQENINQMVSVKAVCLDDWCSAHVGLSVSLVKIDVEGEEKNVLIGAKNVFAAQAPLILCEILSNQAGQDVMGVLPADYLFFHIDENGGINQRQIITREHWHNKNWLFVPESKVGFLEGVL